MPKVSRSRSVSAHLATIFLGTAIPLIILAAAAAFYVGRAEFRSAKRGLEYTARALAAAVDRELHTSIATLEALATSKFIDEGNLQGLHEIVVRILPTQPSWRTVIMQDPSRKNVFHSSFAFGTPRPGTTEPKSFNELIRTQQPTVMNYFDGPVSGPTVGARVPVIRNGALQYVLSATIDAARLDEILQAQQLPQGWYAGVFDQERVQIASSTRNSKANRGRKPGPLISQFPNSANFAWISGPNRAGVDSYAAFVKAPLSGFYVGIIVPQGQMSSTLLNSVWIVSVIGLVALAAGVLLISFYGRLVQRCTGYLIDVAHKIGEGKPVEIVSPAPVTEVNRITNAMAEASTLLQRTQTERDKADAERDRFAESLKEADRRKDEFLAVLGHELRNPLSIISNGVQLLHKFGPPEPKLIELRDMIARQVIHTSRLLDDLLDVSRLSRGKIQLAKARCDLRDLVRKTAEDYRSELDENGLKLELNLPDAPLQMTADPTRVAQALNNLLQNACKFTQPGGTVWVSLHAENHTHAVIKVRDNGAGMDPEVFGWVFEPFRQVADTFDRSRGGLGLGLSLVKGIVELHGGAVTAASAGRGQGSEFTIRLPIDQNQTLSDAVEVVDRSQPSSRRILVIDDNVAGAQSMRMLLEDLGHTVEVAHDGAAGIEAAPRLRAEVVLCDIGLPGIDGYDVARAIRQQPTRDKCLLIAISGYALDEERAREAGFDAHLLKPLDLAKLEALLQEQSGGLMGQSKNADLSTET